jgi:hypothetical protein
VFIMADYHPFGALSGQGEGSEKAPSLHELSLIPLPEDKGHGVMDSLRGQVSTFDIAWRI